MDAVFETPLFFAALKIWVLYHVFRKFVFSAVGQGAIPLCASANQGLNVAGEVLFTWR